MLLPLFLLTALLPLGVVATLVWSILRPERRLWPPIGQQPLRLALTWIVPALTSAGTGAVGILDWNAWGWPAAVRWAGGGGLLLAGSALGLTAALRLGLRTTAGAPGPLVTSGPYRFSRHPQCLADAALAAGFALLSASPRAAALCGISLVAFALFPLAEEPRLAEMHGDAWRAYRRRVRRFF